MQIKVVDHQMYCRQQSILKKKQLKYQELRFFPSFVSIQWYYIVHCVQCTTAKLDRLIRFTDCFTDKTSQHTPVILSFL